jgi:hypothetical protein
MKFEELEAKTKTMTDKEAIEAIHEYLKTWYPDLLPSE